MTLPVARLSLIGTWWREDAPGQKHEAVHLGNRPAELCHGTRIGMGCKLFLKPETPIMRVPPAPTLSGSAMTIPGLHLVVHACACVMACITKEMHLVGSSALQ